MKKYLCEALNCPAVAIIYAVSNFRSGTCHGIVLWVNWDLDGNPEHAISTGPRGTVQINGKMTWDMHTRQGVYFFQTHRLVDSACTFLYRVQFRPQDGDVQFNFDVNSSYD
jgi:hypothetical protein